MKIIAINGAKNTKKDVIALRLSNNSAVEYVRPYSSKKTAHFNWVEKDILKDMIDKEDVLCKTIIRGEIYVFFKFQFTEDYSVVIVDDYALVDLMSNWDDEIVTIRLKSKNAESSERFGSYLYDHEFDIVFNVDTDDYYDLEAMIE